LAERFDVTARLAEGRPAVEHTQTYVQACHALGYQHPDLTAHGSQILDRYDTETGLDLRVLDDDSTTLRRALNTIDEALWRQRAQIADIAAAWSGAGAESATRFLQRHCDAAVQVAERVRAAADGYAALRDKLWQLVDGKATTAIAIDDRRVAERSAWLAAAHTVTAGAGNRSAEELVRQHVTPYVDNDIRTDWLTAMRSAAASAEACYDAAVDALSPTREVCFEIPGELGPSVPAVFDKPVDSNPAAVTVPTTSVPPETVPAAAATPTPAPPPPPPAAGTLDDVPAVPPELTAPLGDAAGLSGGAGDLGSIGGLAGSIGSVVGKIVDGIGGLLGSLADGISGPSGSADPLLDDPLDDDPLGDDDAEIVDDDHPDGTATDVADDTTKVDPPATDETTATEEPPENPSATNDPADQPVAQPIPSPPDDAPPPPDSPPAPAEPQHEGSTPCEIAEDQLPQAGQ
jgi:cell division septation protein DedD